ncbi:glycosyltransferase family 39 protein [Tahibacter harae]|uniref:Glycosyltransferase family 39 protein n=1 Tax=Tahibacter harae TaxID=2963937 RepID=A0ABT1QT61_9GAMM|nr:glycosyltransferase family 39 protein [Tahibacter harae]MCQ4165480.1 glycosyltransferase family 39 protein [Tahibacter harae]
MIETVLEVAAVLLLCALGAAWALDRRGAPRQLAAVLPNNAPPQLTAAARRFLGRLFVAAFLVRFGGVLLISLTDAIRSLSLSPDSLRYHEEALAIAEEMRGGFFNAPNWIDNGWFQFTGLIYYLLGPNPLYIQLINILFGALTPLVVFRLVLEVYGVEKIARVTAMLVAFFPSFIYWSCLMLKDPLSIFSLSLLVLAVVRLRRDFSAGALAAMAFSLMMLLGVREYLFFVSVFLIVISYVPVEGRRTAPLLATMAGVVVLIGAATYSAGFGVFGSDYIRQSHYFDLEYINQSRINISHGTGAFFDEPETAAWGESADSTFRALAAAIYFFFVSIDLTQIGSLRQLMALPEVLVFLLLLPSLMRGLGQSWQQARQASLPLAVFAFGLLAVYGSAATNMGAMFRWRMQALPLLLAFMVYGAFVHGRGPVFNALKRLDF